MMNMKNAPRTERPKEKMVKDRRPRRRDANTLHWRYPPGDDKILQCLWFEQDNYVDHALSMTIARMRPGKAIQEKFSRFALSPIALKRKARSSG